MSKKEAIFRLFVLLVFIIALVYINYWYGDYPFWSLQSAGLFLICVLSIPVVALINHLIDKAIANCFKVSRQVPDTNMQNNVFLLNWDTTKDNPYDYEMGFGFEDKFTPPTFQIANAENNEKTVQKIRFDLNLKALSTIKLSQVTLISGMCDSKMLLFFDEKYLDCSQPITVWLTYPFRHKVKATIYPWVRHFKNSGSERCMDYVGYLVWQIAIVYAEIYKNHVESVGVWGHGFSDLFLEGMNIKEGNIIELLIGS